MAKELRSYLVGWKNYFQLAETPRVFKHLDEWIRRRLRAIQLKQWKRGTTGYRELMAGKCRAAAARRPRTPTVVGERGHGGSNRAAYLVLRRARPTAPCWST